MADVRRLTALGMSTQLADEVAKQIDGGTGYSDAQARTAIATKPAIAELTSESTLSEIVAALQG